MPTAEQKKNCPICKHRSRDDRQCAYCHTFTYGEHKGENPGKKINRVDPEHGLMTGYEMEDAGMTKDDENVSHGSCKDCNKALFSFRKREGFNPSESQLAAERERNLNPPWDYENEPPAEQEGQLTVGGSAARAIARRKALRESGEYTGAFSAADDE